MSMVVAALLLAFTLGAQDNSMNSLGERYVRLVLAMGQHDADYVDAYYGPSEWRKGAEAQKIPLPEITSRAAALAREIAARAPAPSGDELTRLRHEYLARQLESLRARASILSGTRSTFDEESKALYDAVAPAHMAAEFEGVLAALDARLPGSGSLTQRYDAFRSRYIVRRDRLDVTFKAAIDGCRSRTLQHITLPPSESFTVEYVTVQPGEGHGRRACRSARRHAGQSCEAMGRIRAAHFVAAPAVGAHNTQIPLTWSA